MTTSSLRKAARIVGGIIGFLVGALVCLLVWGGLAYGMWNAVTETPAFGVFVVIVILCLPLIVAYNHRHGG